MYFILAENGSAPSDPSTRGRQTPSFELIVTAVLDNSSPGSPSALTALATHSTRLPVCRNMEIVKTNRLPWIWLSLFRIKIFYSVDFRPTRPLLRPHLVAVAEATWKNKKLYMGHFFNMATIQENVTLLHSTALALNAI